MIKVSKLKNIIIKPKSDKFDPYSAKNFGPLDFYFNIIKKY